MRFRLIPLLALLPLPVAAADDLGWHVQVSVASKFAPVEFQAQLRNVSSKKIAFRAEGDRPLMTLILEAEGKEPVRKRLPKEAYVSKGPRELEPAQFAWHVTGDLRHAFGRLAPGRYTLRADIEGRVSEPAAFEVIDTSLEDAKSVPPEGIELRLKGKGVAVLANRRKTPIRLWAYMGQGPLQALVTLQQWTGKGWTASPGGYCGTGLEEVTIAAGGEREIAVPPLPDGILRLAVACFDGIEALSEPFLVDNFKG